MLNFLRKLFFADPIKKIAFMDGDQDILAGLRAYDTHIKNTGTETHFVRMKPENHAAPKAMEAYTDINQVYLSGFKRGKEVTDKYIAAMIQQAVDNGYQHITVVSADYDFIDIFKMAVMINPDATNVTFRMIVPTGGAPVGKQLQSMANQGTKIANIEVVKA